jgi:ABC-type molybdate transport system substrate-binding protein
MRKAGRFEVIPSRLHDPIIHDMVLLSGSGPQAQRLFDYLLSGEAHRILAAYGFAGK